VGLSPVDARRTQEAAEHIGQHATVAVVVRFTMGVEPYAGNIGQPACCCSAMGRRVLHGRRARRRPARLRLPGLRPGPTGPAGTVSSALVGQASVPTLVPLMRQLGGAAGGGVHRHTAHKSGRVNLWQAGLGPSKRPTARALDPPELPCCGSAPPESNRRPQPHHRCAGGSQGRAAPHVPT
jgi:hypothetical protein